MIFFIALLTNHFLMEFAELICYIQLKFVAVYIKDNSQPTFPSVNHISELLIDRDIFITDGTFEHTGLRLNSLHNTSYANLVKTWQ